MTTTILTTLDVAKLTARLEGEGGYKRAATKDAAIARFLKSAEAKGIRHAAASLCLTQPKKLAEAEALVDTALGAADAIAQDDAATAATKAARKAAAESRTDEQIADAVLTSTPPAKARKSKTPQVPAIDGMAPLGAAAPARKKVDDDMPDFLVRRGDKAENEASEAAWAKAAERRKARQEAEEAAKPKAEPKAASRKASATRREPGANGLPKGSKNELIATMLLDPAGCTTAEVLKATGWPAVSMPQQARIAGLELRKEKVAGSPSRYYGKPGTTAKAKARKGKKAA